MKRVAIIGGGISGLAALHFLRSRCRDQIQVTLFEKESRLGGTIGTDCQDGFISDWGPNGFLDRVPLTLQMVADLKASHLLTPAVSVSGRRFIYAHTRLHEVFPSPARFLSSPLLSLKGRLRLTMEPFIRARRDWQDDESIFDFAMRRIGREAAETLIDPLVSGIYGGDSHQLSLAACFSVMLEMEKEHGSLVRGMVARRRKARKVGQPNAGGPAGPAGRLTSFKGGLHSLILRLHEQYSEWICLNRSVTRIIPSSGGVYRVEFATQPGEEYEAVICATPAYAAAEILTDLDNPLAETLASIPYAPIAVVCLGYDRHKVGHNLDGFGFIVPRREGKRILGTIWTSSIFPEQVPEGMVQLRTMVGGATNIEAINLTNEALTELVVNDLRPILDLTGRSVYAKVFKYGRGIPQFVIGHPYRVKTIDSILRKYPHLYLTGNAYEGVGLNDCVLRSEKIVTRLAHKLSN